MDELSQNDSEFAGAGVDCVAESVGKIDYNLDELEEDDLTSSDIHQVLTDHLLPPVFLELLELVLFALAPDLILDLWVVMLRVRLCLGDNLFGCLASIALLLRPDLTSLLNLVLASLDALLSRIDLHVHREQQGVGPSIHAELVLGQLVFQALAWRVVFLDHFDELVRLKFLMIKDVRLLEDVDHFSHVEGHVLLQTEDGCRALLFVLLLVLLREVSEHGSELHLELLEHSLSQLEVLVVIAALSLVLGGKGGQLLLEEVLHLVGERWELAVVSILDSSGTHKCLEELSLQDHFAGVVDVLGLDLIVAEAVDVSVLLFLGEVVGVVVEDGVATGGVRVRLVLGLVVAVHEVELAHFTCSQEGVVVLASLHVDPVELGDGGVLVDDLTVAEEAPHLTQSHTEALLRFLCLDLPRVVVIPGLQITVVSQQDVLAFFLDLLWVGLELYQVRDVDQFLERVLLDLLFGRL